MNPLEKVSEVGDIVGRAIGMAQSKKEIIGKQIINVFLLFIILLVFGCLDFATLEFHFEYISTISYWSTVGTKVIAGICAFNIGINIMWENELKKDMILAKAIRIYNLLITYKKDNFEYFVTHEFNPAEKRKAYISQINHKIFILNKFSRAKDRLLYSSDLPERQEEKKHNKYCIRRQELEDLKNEEFITKNIDALKVRYHEVDATVFDLEINGAVPIHGVKTKGNITAGKAKETSNVVMGIFCFSMFITAFTLTANKEQFESQMVAFWHYCLKCCEDVGIVLWQLTKGMLKTRKIISSELTQPYVGRNKVLLRYVKWCSDNQTMEKETFSKIENEIKFINGDDESEIIEITEEELKTINEEKENK